MSRKKSTTKKPHNKTSKRTTDEYKDTDFYPIIKAFDEGFLQVSKIHKIAYFLYGNKNGKPVLVVHGGPGGGTKPTYARYFNPKKYFIILVDQRGAGKSTPFGETRDNTTQDLVEDFEKIRSLLGVKKWQVFGGSWGSTLSLAYSMAHPSVVSEIVLRGIFVFRQKEINWVQQGPGANFVFPDAWEYYKEVIPVSEQGDFMKAFGKRFNGSMGKKAKDAACLAWSQWEGSISHLHQPTHAEVMKSVKQGNNYIPMSLIEYHYFTHMGFFPREGYLLEDKNIDKIKHLPIVIVQGQYDMVCPMVTAYDLYKKLPNSTFYKTIAGHSMLEEQNIKFLVKATNDFA